jgi:hypothetical protein
MQKRQGSREKDQAFWYWFQLELLVWKKNFPALVIFIQVQNRGKVPPMELVP